LAAGHVEFQYAQHGDEARDVVNDNFGKGSKMRQLLGVDDGADAPAHLFGCVEGTNQPANVGLGGCGDDSSTAGGDGGYIEDDASQYAKVEVMPLAEVLLELLVESGVEVANKGLGTELYQRPEKQAGHKGDEWNLWLAADKERLDTHRPACKERKRLFWPGKEDGEVDEEAQRRRRSTAWRWNIECP